MAFFAENDIDREHSQQQTARIEMNTRNLKKCDAEALRKNHCNVSLIFLQ